ncbi:GNAT family N-acetyltransferase [Aquimarina aggregata]|uniref:GNAT family N-acetyltransferase n=1 Tax=Aquimarina aggregata TaxID=1642818 RepID=UPI00248F6D22|nr:GNAT family N-acetyltransferase [Aquimarina aggregata]
MVSKTILTTSRLSLREFDINDASFILELLNSPNWLRFIGDKGVKTIEDATNYLKNGPIQSYLNNGFGLWLVELKGTNTPIGMCGLVNREILDNIDIGFAMLPNYMGLGYGFEIAYATLHYAKSNLKIPKIIAITDTNNIASIKLLTKIGLRFDKTLNLPEGDSVLVFSPPKYNNDLSKIDKLTTSFFSLFSNINGQIPNVKKVKDLFISQGILINNSNESQEIYNLEDFIIPREEILTNGTLVDFNEFEISHTTEVFDTIAHRFSLYQKSGKSNGIPFEPKGMKTIQFVKINQNWKISSVVWSDQT